jgi:micrococcal nuclease
MISPRAGRLAFILVLSALTAAPLFPDEPRTIEGRVEKVFDGDTVKVRLDTGGREVVRFLGIDTPESYVTRYGYTEFLGSEASKFTRDLLAGKRVRLAAQTRGGAVIRDRHGRLLAFVYHENRDICALLLEKGLARVYRKSPSPRHGELVKLESTAKSSGLGIWNAAAEKDFYRRQFRDNRNRHLVLWFWDNDREFLKTLLCESDKNSGTSPRRP